MRQHPTGIMVSLAALGLAGLIADTFAVETGVSGAFDRMGVLSIHRNVSAHLKGVMDALSFLGNTSESVGIGLVVALFLLTSRRYALAVVPIFGPAGASLLADLLKHVFQRPRPHLWPNADILHTYSFPSGHATASAALAIAVVWVTLAFDSRVLRLATAGLALAFSLCVGLSRVYLGVHWPTDVLGGYALALFCVPLAGLLSSQLAANGFVLSLREGAWRLPGRYKAER